MNKTQGEIEALISEALIGFEQDYMGRGPSDIHTHLIGDLVVIRLHGVLTSAEKSLVDTQPPDRGRDLLKQVRTQLIETARPLLASLLSDIVGGMVVSMHHDISTITGEEVVLFALDRAPALRQGKGKQG